MFDISGNRAGGVIAATVIGMILPTIAVICRITARHLTGVKLYPDDYMIIIALLLKLGIDIAGCILIQHGLGRHLATLTAYELTTFLKVQYTGSLLYPLCVSFTKLSICYQYRRIFTGRFFRFAVDLVIAVIILWCISVCFTGVFICTPIDKSWMPTKPGNCINMVSFYYGLQIPNVITDAVILIIPLKEVVGLDLPANQKVGIALTCALWLLCLVFGIVRLVVMLALGSRGTDLTWILVEPAIWTSLEPTVGVVTACLPASRVVYRAIVKAITHREDPNDTWRLDSVSKGSTTCNGKTLVERPRSPPTLDYGKCMGDNESLDEGISKYPNYGKCMGDNESLNEGISKYPNYNKCMGDNEPLNEGIYKYPSTVTSPLPSRSMDMKDFSSDSRYRVSCISTNQRSSLTNSFEDDK